MPKSADGLRGIDSSVSMCRFIRFRMLMTLMTLFSDAADADEPDDAGCLVQVTVLSMPDRQQYLVVTPANIIWVSAGFWESDCLMITHMYVCRVTTLLYP
jgi:hypothetical protein